MKNYSKLFLISLLAASMMLAGCGESNPTSTSSETAAATTTTPTAVDTSSSNSFRVWGGITCDGSAISDSITIKLLNKGTGQTFSTSESSSYAFEGVTSGVYELKASGTGYDVYQTCQEISTTQMINIDMQRTSTTPTTSIPKINFQGSLVDQIGKPIPFATIKAVKNGSDEIIASTEFNNEKYTLLALSSGTYKLTFTKDSFVEIKDMELKITDDYISFNGSRIEKANFGNTDNFNDAAGNSHKGYKLAKVIMSPNVLQTGSIAGVICLNGNPVAEGTSVDLYKRQSDSVYSVPSFVMTVKAGVNGYFYAKNLPSGFYTAVTNGTSPTQGAADSQGIPYTFNAGVYFANMEVKDNFMTPVPSTSE